MSQGLLTFFDLPFYDSGARFQRNDGIFLSIDPLAEKYYGISPYAYCSGNPVRYSDNDGNDRKDKVVGLAIGVEGVNLERILHQYTINKKGFRKDDKISK